MTLYCGDVPGRLIGAPQRRDELIFFLFSNAEELWRSKRRRSRTLISAAVDASVLPSAVKSCPDLSRTLSWKLVCEWPTRCLNWFYFLFCRFWFMKNQFRTDIVNLSPQSFVSMGHERTNEPQPRLISQDLTRLNCSTNKAKSLQYHFMNRP